MGRICGCRIRESPPPTGRRWRCIPGRWTWRSINRWASRTLAVIRNWTPRSVNWRRKSTRENGARSEGLRPQAFDNPAHPRLFRVEAGKGSELALRVIEQAELRIGDSAEQARLAGSVQRGFHADHCRLG